MLAVLQSALQVAGEPVGIASHPRVRTRSRGRVSQSIISIWSASACASSCAKADPARTNKYQITRLTWRFTESASQAVPADNPR